MLTSIVVVSHDSGDLLLRCVAAALAQGVAVEVIVVDNASRDGAPLRLPSDARLQVIANRDNRGFGAACNQGAALARGQSLLLLNPDCVLPVDALHDLHAIRNAHPEFALLGAQLLNSDGTPQAAARRRTPTPARAIRRALGLRDALEIEPPGEFPTAGAQVSEVDAISGALMFMQRDVFDRLGGFDEGYVLHCEDLDLCRRVLLAGHRIGVANDVRVTHHKGTSSRRRPVWVEWQKHRGMLRYFRKFDAAGSPRWLRALVPVAVWLRFPLAALRALRSAHQR
jgi:N-acetylglucosaminyl-diphospho-decaprenol L-rhamnosyltransferase